MISNEPSKSTSASTGAERAAFVSPRSTCHARSASSPEKRDNFVDDVDVLSWSTTANRPNGAQRWVAPGVVVRLSEKFPMIEPYASEPISSSSATQLITGSSMVSIVPVSAS